MSKRKRQDQDGSGYPWWGPLVYWIRSNGGFVHDNVHLSQGRELQVGATIDPDELLLKIPASCLITPQLAVQSIPLLSRLEGTEDDVVNDNANKENEFHYPVSDLILAIFLAGKPSAVKAYLESLPPSSAFDALPRRWKDEDIHTFLKGSPLIRRVQQAKVNVIQDYQNASRRVLYADDDETSAKKFPEFDEFSTMLAAVSSRAFGFDDSTMVPLLDLCNHSRGKDDRKNLTYERDEDGSVSVKTTTRIEKEEVLRITYGARGNHQLLMNYGFTIPNNVEPDGSSNDILEVTLEPNLVVELRAGPKAYSYGGFVKALEYFIQGNINQDCSSHASWRSGTGPDIENEMEDFLNSCEDGDEANEESDNHHDDEDEAFDETEENGNHISKELEALSNFHSLLLEERGARPSDKELKEASSKQEVFAPEQFSSILIESELRTIAFFLASIEKTDFLLRKQYRIKGKSKIETHNKQSTEADSSAASTRSQVEELADAYLKIRHGDL